METGQGVAGSSSAPDRSSTPPRPRSGFRAAAIVLAALSAIATVIGLLSFVGRFLFPAGLGGAVVQLLEAGVILLVPAALLSAVSAVLSRWSRTRIVAGCAVGILAVCLLTIGATGYLYKDFRTRQWLAAMRCKPGCHLTFSCQPAIRPDGSLEAARLVVAKRLDPLALGGARVVARPPDGMTVDLDRRLVLREQERIDALVRFIEQRGILEFRVLPVMNREEPNAGQMDQYAKALSEKGPGAVLDGPYTWIPIKDINEWHSPASIVGQSGDRYCVLASDRSGEVMLRSPDGRGWSIENAYPTEDEMGRMAIGFRLDKQGGDLFWNLTSKNGGRPLAIVLDSVVISAPVINPDSPIRQTGVITGIFTAAEVNDMVAVLNCTPLPLDLHLVESSWEDWRQTSTDIYNKGHIGHAVR